MRVAAVLGCTLCALQSFCPASPVTVYFNPQTLFQSKLPLEISLLLLFFSLTDVGTGIDQFLL